MQPDLYAISALIAARGRNRLDTYSRGWPGRAAITFKSVVGDFAHCICICTLTVDQQQHCKIDDGQPEDTTPALLSSSISRLQGWADIWPVQALSERVDAQSLEGGE